MSLTLEEKQRLAKEQEQAAKLRNQQPLAPQTIKPATTSNSQVKTAYFRLQHAVMLKHKTNLTLFIVADKGSDQQPSQQHDIAKQPVLGQHSTTSHSAGLHHLCLPLCQPHGWLHGRLSL